MKFGTDLCPMSPLQTRNFWFLAHCNTIVTDGQIREVDVNAITHNPLCLHIVVGIHCCYQMNIIAISGLMSKVLSHLY
jgi:hypothetical protein